MFSLRLPKLIVVKSCFFINYYKFIVSIHPSPTLLVWPIKKLCNTKNNVLRNTCLTLQMLSLVVYVTDRIDITPQVASLSCATSQAFIYKLSGAHNLIMPLLLRSAWYRTQFIGLAYNYTYILQANKLDSIVAVHPQILVLWARLKKESRNIDTA